MTLVEICFTGEKNHFAESVKMKQSIQTAPISKKLVSIVSFLLEKRGKHIKSIGGWTEAPTMRIVFLVCHHLMIF